MRVALIGYGYWGINLARTINNNKNFILETIYDGDFERISEARKLYDFRVYQSFEDILRDSNIEAIFIATPPYSHFMLAKKALESKKHIFVEKPLTTSLKEAEELYELAYKLNLKVLCDHIFLHSEPIKYLKNNLQDFGDIVYINARRINLGLFQSSVDVVWDLAVHDLAIIDYLVNLNIKKSSNYKAKYQDYKHDAIANIQLELESGVLVNINVSWLSPFKIREMIIGGTKKSALFDDTASDKLRVYDAGVIFDGEYKKDELYNKMIKYHLGEESRPKFSHKLSLDSCIEEFYECLTSNKKPVADKEHILRVIKTLEILSKK